MEKQCEVCKGAGVYERFVELEEGGAYAGMDAEFICGCRYPHAPEK
jgi:hypothetical protein